MKIALVSVEDNIMTTGFRKIAAFVKTLNQDTQVYYVHSRSFRGIMGIILGKRGGSVVSDEDSVRRIAEPLAEADIVGFSAMTEYAPLVKRIISHIRALNPRSYILWGGIHPIIDPDDAIQEADAVCTGEGEFAFKQFFDAFKEGKDFRTAGNFWFRDPRMPGAVIKNPFLPLMTNEEMSSLPPQQYGRDELIFDHVEKKYVPLTRDIYLNFNGLAYHTIWTIGCPFKCAYCSNTKFIENNKLYSKLRHSSIDYIINEIRQALRIHPHLSSINFDDDGFIALPLETLQEFSEKYSEQIGIPLVIMGVIPTYLNASEKKLEVLLKAGLYQIRMGIQNGSQRILKLYERPTSNATLNSAVRIINRYAKYLIPPAYDIIVDNPLETQQDVLENLEFLYQVPKPYTLNVYGLRVIPNTRLQKLFKERNVPFIGIETSFQHIAPTMANVLVYLLATFKLPHSIFRFLLRFARPHTEQQRLFPWLLKATRVLYIIKRGLDHLRFMDFSVIPARTGYVLWKTGLIRFWRAHFVPRYPG